MVKDFLDVYVSCVTADGRVVDSNMNGFYSFSGNLFSILVYYFEVENNGLGVVVGNVVFVNCTGDMTIVFLLYFPNICWILLCKKGCNFF